MRTALVDTDIFSEILVLIDTEIATLAGRIYADLERAGRPIGRANPMVAACALARDCDLVTGNVAHFEAVRSVGYPLAIDNWRVAIPAT